MKVRSLPLHYIHYQNILYFLLILGHQNSKSVALKYGTSKQGAELRLLKSKSETIVRNNGHNSERQELNIDSETTLIGDKITIRKDGAIAEGNAKPVNKNRDKSKVDKSSNKATEATIKVDTCGNQARG